MPRQRWLWMVVVMVGGLTLSLALASEARANVAPPEEASGAGPAPAQATTRVRMESEHVVLVVAADGRQASVTAEYRLRNQAGAPETLALRFPLAYLTGEGSAPDPCPEIQDLQVWVNGQAVPWQRVQSTPTSFCHQASAPWAEFSVTFPPKEPVTVRVTYTQRAWGYEPYWMLSYIVETGAGWHDTIGQGTIEVVMPYEVSPANILLEEGVGYGPTTPQPRLEGRTVRWTFANLEPRAADNVTVLYVDPARWNEVRSAREQVKARPEDGAAWAALGAALTRVLALPTGWEMALGVRTDPAARELMQEALDAYAQAVRWQPQDLNGRVAYAALLVAAAQALEETDGDPGQAHAYRHEAAQQLAYVAQQDPNHEGLRTFLSRYARLLPGWVEVQGETVHFVGLTATPPGPTPRATTPTATPQPRLPAAGSDAEHPPATTVAAAAPAGPNPPSAPATPTPATGTPRGMKMLMGLLTCGGVGFLLVALLFVVLGWRAGRAARPSR